MTPHVGWESDFQPMIRSHAPDALTFLVQDTRGIRGERKAERSVPEHSGDHKIRRHCLVELSPIGNLIVPVVTIHSDAPWK